MSDVREGRIGTLGAETDKLAELQERLPRKVWTFIAPKGMKGKIRVPRSVLAFLRDAGLVVEGRPRLVSAAQEALF